MKCGIENCNNEATKDIITSYSIPGFGPVEQRMELCEHHYTKLKIILNNKEKKLNENR